MSSAKSPPPAPGSGPARLRVATLPAHKATRFCLIPTPRECAGIAAGLGLLDLRKLRLTGEVTADGAQNWHLSAHLGATVDQACVRTLVPVRARIEENITRRFLAHLPDGPAGEEGPPESGAAKISAKISAEIFAEMAAEMAAEISGEISGDDNIERLEAEIDLWAVMVESLALALPLYPRAAEAGPGEARVAPPGIRPMRDQDARPFAGLAALRDRLSHDK